jgi:hypothetical protein
MAAGAPSIPAKIRPVHDAIAARLEAFAAARLNAEYAGLCLRMLGVLARKRPTPLVNGRPDSWASGIVRAVGRVNFLDDPARSPHVKTREIDDYFGVSTATGSARAKQIRDLLRLRPFDVEWSLASMIDRNPFAWLIQVNGMLVDVRAMPREVQEQAYHMGLIPYLPAAPSAGNSGDEPGEG